MIIYGHFIIAYHFIACQKRRSFPTYCQRMIKIQFSLFSSATFVLFHHKHFAAMALYHKLRAIMLFQQVLQEDEWLSFSVESVLFIIT